MADKKVFLFTCMDVKAVWHSYTISLRQTYQDWGKLWTHVSELTGWKNEVVGLYGIKAIPQNFLIDPTGKIIAKNLHGNQLTELLKKLL